MDYNGFVNPNVSNDIVAGTWTLFVYQGGTYYGTLYGEIVGGSIKWQTSRLGEITGRYTEAKLKILGGLDGFNNHPVDDVSKVLLITTPFDKNGASSMATLTNPF